MNEIKIVKNEKIVINDDNYRDIYFLQANAIAILKVVNFLCKESKMLFNPIDVIKRELILKGEIDNNDNFLLYNSSVSCLITACKYLDKELKVCKNNLLDTKLN